MFEKELKRKRRHYYIRKKVIGTEEIPRLNIRRSLANLHVQLVDDINEKTIISASTIGKEFRQKYGYGGNVKAAEFLGEIFAGKMKDKGIERICFDRGGYRYHGRVKAFADKLRNNKIKF